MEFQRDVIETTQDEINEPQNMFKIVTNNEACVHKISFVPYSRALNIPELNKCLTQRGIRALIGIRLGYVRFKSQDIKKTDEDIRKCIMRIIPDASLFLSDDRSGTYVTPLELLTDCNAPRELVYFLWCTLAEPNCSKMSINKIMSLIKRVTDMHNKIRQRIPSNRITGSLRRYFAKCTKEIDDASMREPVGWTICDIETLMYIMKLNH